jgi:uncharacterized membrane protein YsdA (DUF1294 family)
MGYDKQAARWGCQRTPEAVLALWTLGGGTLGTMVGMRWFRHKIRKPRFHLLIGVVLVIQIMTIYVLRDVMQYRNRQLQEPEPVLYFAQSDLGRR